MLPHTKQALARAQQASRLAKEISMTEKQWLKDEAGETMALV